MELLGQRDREILRAHPLLPDPPVDLAGPDMLSFPPGDWYIGINGFEAYAGLSLTTSSH